MKKIIFFVLILLLISVLINIIYFIKNDKLNSVIDSVTYIKNGYEKQLEVIKEQEKTKDTSNLNSKKEKGIFDTESYKKEAIEKGRASRIVQSANRNGIKLTVEDKNYIFTHIYTEEQEEHLNEEFSKPNPDKTEIDKIIYDKKNKPKK